MTPAGLDNQEIQNTLTDIILLSISYLVLAVLLSPLWSYRMDSYPGALGQIITNLITNALFHAWNDEESGILRISCCRVTNAYNNEEPMVRISVEDNGKGIPERNHARIFDPFFTTRMGRGGTGLDLNIAFNNARNNLGGTLDITSSEGEGSVFKLEIPRVAPTLKNETSNISHTQKKPGGPGP
jgi:signal transduction histidine kinase